MPKNHRSQHHYRNLAGSKYGAHAKPPCVRYIPQAQLAPHDSYRIGNASREGMRLRGEGGLKLTHRLNPNLIFIR